MQGIKYVNLKYVNSENLISLSNLKYVNLEWGLSCGFPYKRIGWGEMKEDKVDKTLSFILIYLF